MFWKRFTLRLEVRCKWCYHHTNQDILEDTLLVRESCSGCPHILPTRTLCSPHPRHFHPNGQSRRWIEKLVKVFIISVTFLIGLLIVVRLWPSSSQPARTSVKWKTAQFFGSRIVLHHWLVSSTAREALCLLYKNTLWDLWGFKTEKLWGSKAHFQKTLWFWSLIYHDLIIFGVLGTSKPADLIISMWILSMSSWKQYSKDYSWRFSCLKCPCQYWSLILRMFNMEINFLKNCWLTQFVTPLACLATSGKKTTLVAKLFALPSQPPQVNCLQEESSGELNHLKNDEENLKWENITW